MTPIIIDNFLEEEYFNTLIDSICRTDQQGIPWSYGVYHPHITVLEKKHYDVNDPLEYFFTHVFYNFRIIRAPDLMLTSGFIILLCNLGICKAY